MIKLEHVVLASPEQMEFIIEGMRNPMNSWENSDSGFQCSGLKNGCDTRACQGCRSYNLNDYEVGDADLNLMQRLAKAGTDHRKFMRMMPVYVRITAPLYWWKEFDTYKVATVANSCSTMHKIQEKEFTLEDFSHEHLTGETDGLWVNADGRDFMCSAWDFCQITCDVLNHYRELYLETKDKKYWWQMIQLLPNVMMNYEVLANIYKSRKDHKLDEWREFCQWIEELPYSELIIGFREYDAVEYGKEHPEFVEKIQQAAKGESYNE